MGKKPEDMTHEEFMYSLERTLWDKEPDDSTQAIPKKFRIQIIGPEMGDPFAYPTILPPDSPAAKR